MNEFIGPILRLDTASFKENVIHTVRDEDYNLVSKLIVTSIRRFAMNLIGSNRGKSILDIVMLLTKQISGFANAAVEFNSDLSAEIKSLLYSLISLNFSDGFSDFSFGNDSFEWLGNDVCSALSFCGFSSTFRTLIVEHIEKECLDVISSFDDNYEESALDEAREKLRTLIEKYRTKFPEIILEKKKLKMSIFKNVLEMRLDKIFEIVNFFPESKCALLDLKECCLKTSSHQKIAETIIKVFVSRLLHLGALTSDIVFQYINSVKAFNIIDESGGLTRAISVPIQKYLATRSDLLNTIVFQILDNGELVRVDAAMQKPNDDDIIREADVQKKLDFEWNPEPLHSHIKDLESLIHDTYNSDELALLINVYGSMNTFKEQLEKEISRRFQNLPGFVFNDEKKAIDRLKNRFGSQSFIKCDVIVKDLNDSECFLRSFNCDKVQPLIISSMYWPPLANESLKLPNEIEIEIKKYTEKFEDLKNPRKLKWHNSIGAVEIELEFNNNETLKITVPPIPATIALLMNDNESITMEYITKTLEISRQSAETALNFWVSNNIFIKDGDKYYMSETKPIVINSAYSEEYATKENDNDTKEEIEPHIRDGILFAKIILNILQAKDKENLTLQDFYALLGKIIQYPKFNHTYEQYLKIMKFYESKNILRISGDPMVVHAVENAEEEIKKFT